MNGKNFFWLGNLCDGDSPSLKSHGPLIVDFHIQCQYGHRRIFFEIFFSYFW